MSVLDLKALGLPVRSALVPAEPGYIAERRTTLVDDQGAEIVVRERCSGSAIDGYHWHTDIAPDDGRTPR